MLYHTIRAIDERKLLWKVISLPWFVTQRSYDNDTLRRTCDQHQRQSEDEKQCPKGTSKYYMDKETIIATSKAIGRSLINYATPIWTSFLSNTQWRILQTTQNNIFRMVTGCVEKTNIDYLHKESQMLLVRKHNELLTKQYLITCYLPSHAFPINIQS